MINFLSDSVVIEKIIKSKRQDLDSVKITLYFFFNLKIVKHLRINTVNKQTKAFLPAFNHAFDFLIRSTGPVKIKINIQTMTCT